MSGAEWCHFHLGAQGSGKTWRLKAKAAAWARLGYGRAGGRVIVADVRREWPRGEREPWSPLTVGSRIDVGLCGGGRMPDPARLAEITVCRPRDALDDEATREWCDRLCELALRRGSVVLVLPEVWRYAPERGYARGGIVPRLAQFVHEHRHSSCALWADSQRYAETAKELIDRCGVHVVHGVASMSDLDRLARMGGAPLVDAVREVMRRNRGSPGHHVVWKQSEPFGPFVLRDGSGSALETR